MKKWGLFAIIILIILVVATYALFGSRGEMTGYATSDSQVGNLTASVQTYMACTWSSATLNVSFGNSLNPGTDDINATGNYNLSLGGENGTMYNVTVDTLSTANADITVAGNDMVYSGNTIDIGNVTWSSSNSIHNDTSMDAGSSVSVTGSAVDMATNVASENNVFYRFWLDVPSGTVAGNYVGNYTIVCEQTD